MPLYKVPHQTHLENCSSQPYSIKETEMRRATYKSTRNIRRMGSSYLKKILVEQLVCMSKTKIQKGYDSVLEYVIREALRKEAVKAKYQ